jgi:hypothetical protein
MYSGQRRRIKPNTLSAGEMDRQERRYVRKTARRSLFRPDSRVLTAANAFDDRIKTLTPLGSVVDDEAKRPPRGEPLNCRTDLSDYLSSSPVLLLKLFSLTQLQFLTSQRSQLRHQYSLGLRDPYTYAYTWDLHYDHHDGRQHQRQYDLALLPYAQAPSPPILVNPSIPIAPPS